MYFDAFISLYNNSLIIDLTQVQNVIILTRFNLQLRICHVSNPYNKAQSMRDRDI